jgi:hypothetical protein
MKIYIVRNLMVRVGILDVDILFYIFGQTLCSLTFKNKYTHYILARREHTLYFGIEGVLGWRSSRKSRINLMFRANPCLWCCPIGLATSKLKSNALPLYDCLGILSVRKVRFGFEIVKVVQ